MRSELHRTRHRPNNGLELKFLDPNLAANNGFTIGIRALGPTCSQCLAQILKTIVSSVSSTSRTLSRSSWLETTAISSSGMPAKDRAGLILGKKNLINYGLETCPNAGRHKRWHRDFGGEVAALVSGIAEIKFALDVGLTGAVAIGCAFHRQLFVRRRRREWDNKGAAKRGSAWESAGIVSDRWDVAQQRNGKVLWSACTRTM